ncbi:hypothetical protein ACIA5H_37090 [Nocardia sp. NPDC051900]|uniref:hypothetical protein n=1 Tax=Nocardia sp. NPDC051900 TaxID=3364326 RepID=UPI00379CE672
MTDQTTAPTVPDHNHRLTDEDLRRIAEDPWITWAVEIPRRIAAELRELRARVAELEARRPIGHIVGYREPRGEWWISYEGKPFTREEATDDLHDACNDVPGVDWRVLTVYDETGEPYQAQEEADRG